MKKVTSLNIERRTEPRVCGREGEGGEGVREEEREKEAECKVNASRNVTKKLATFSFTFSVRRDGVCVCV